MGFLKTVTGKVISGLVTLAVIAAAISWWQMEPQTRQMLVHGGGKIIGWLVVVLILPFASYFVSVRVGKLESNLAGGLLVLSYTAAELVLLLWLFDWSIRGAAGWTFVLVGGLLAGTYNLLVCDWIAERLT